MFAALVLSSCYQSETTIHLKKDGSGTLVEENRFSDQALKMTKSRGLKDPHTETRSFKPLLTSAPPMSPEDILATLYHETGFSSLSLTDQDGVKRRLSWFSFYRPK